MSEATRKRDERLINVVCPNCNAQLDDATNLDDESLRPKPGDVSCCIKCAAVLEYQDDMTLRVLSSDELLDLPDDVRLEIVSYSQAVLKMHSIIEGEA